MTIFRKPKTVLFFFFLLALVIRFWWFPQNLYFGFDQARDAFISQNIYFKGDLKIIGPSTGTEGLFHGPFWWYLIGPFYLLGRGNPVFPAAFVIFLNALGVFLIFKAGEILFNLRVGFIAAFLYAISFCQSQYALYFGNPAPAVLSILIFYLGFVLALFRHDKRGWFLVGLGLGISIQSEFFLIYLFIPAIFYLVIFRKEVRKGFNPRYFIGGVVAFVLSVSTFILAEVKFNFRTVKTLFSMFFLSGGGSGELFTQINHFLTRVGTEINDNLFSFLPGGFKFLTIPLFFIPLIVVFRRINKPREIAFLLVWVLSNFILDFIGAPRLYYVNIGVAAGILLLASCFLSLAFLKNKFLFFGLIMVIFLSNLRLIIKQDPRGPIKTLYVQEEMLLVNEKKVLDLIYKDAGGELFVFNALTMPYKIKTTWAYLFNWYGKGRYGYLPFWGGEDVPGYPGDLPKPDAKKYFRYSVVEPTTTGIPEWLRQEFQNNENAYSFPVWEKKIGQFLVQKRNEKIRR